MPKAFTVTVYVPGVLNFARSSAFNIASVKGTVVVVPSEYPAVTV